MSHGVANATSGATASTPRAWTNASARVVKTSDTVTRAPSSTSMRARCAPTWPTPWTTTWRSRSVGSPSSSAMVARIAHFTPYAVTGEGSPEPPCASSTPVTHGVTRARPFMSAVVAPRSSAAR